MKRCGTRLAALVAWGGSVVLGGAAWGQVCEFEKVREYRLGQVFWDARSIEQAGDLLYITISWPHQDLRVYDISDPEMLRLLSTSSFAPAESVAVASSLVVLSGRHSVATIDTADPEAPRLLDRIETAGDGYNVVIDGSVAFVADGHRGVVAVDISEPEALRVLDVLETSWRSYQIAVHDGVAYVADGDGGLRVIDVRDPAHMVEIARLMLGTRVYALAMDSAVIGLAAGRQGTVFVDVSDPAAPQVIGRLDTGIRPTALKLADSVAWIAGGGISGPAEFLGVDIRDPSVPTVFGRVGFAPHDRGAYAMDFAMSEASAHILLNQTETLSYPPVEVELHTLDLSVCAVCYADCDGSGVLDFFDFLCFQNLFAAGDPRADCDGSGELDVFDFLCFQSEFAAGCS